MAIAVVQSKKVIVTSSDSAAVTFDSTPTAGNLILVFASNFPGSASTATCTDNKSNTYSQVFTAQDTSTSSRVWHWYAKNVTSSATFTITVNPTGASADITVVIVEVSGADTTAPLDQNNTATGNGTAPTVSVTTSTNNEGYFGVLTHNGTNRTLTENGSYSLIDENEGGTSNMPISVEWRTTTSGTISASWTIGTGAVDWVCGVASYLASSAAARVDRPVKVVQAVKRSAVY